MSSLNRILNVAGTILSHMVTNNYIADRAVDSGMTYREYCILCKCLVRVPMTDRQYEAKITEHRQLNLEGIA